MSRITDGIAEARRARTQYRLYLEADLPRNPYPTWQRSVKVWRALQVTHEPKGLPLIVIRKIVVLADIVWLQWIMGAELPSHVVPGPGLRLPHGARGCVLHPSVTIGDRFEMMHRVTIGVRDDFGAAQIGNDVFVGAGVTIIGAITIADGSQIGSNAVLVHDTEPGAAYGGVPAKLLKRSSEPA